MNTEKLKNIFLEIITEEQIKTDDLSCSSYGNDWAKSVNGKASIVLLPKSTNELSKILKKCNEKNINVIPSGGRTGTSGGASATNSEVVISLEKLNKITHTDPDSFLIRCGAGTITENIQEKAKEHDLYFPIDFASTGSSQIGGNIATNAGGVHVIRYGTFKEWVLGLEVVLADGTILNLNGSLIKNQTGYNLKSLFIGSEGTLGIITGATLKLCPPPGIITRAFIGLNNSKNMLPVLAKVRKQIPTISMCEYVPKNGLQKVIEHSDRKNPFQDVWDHYLLIEVEQSSEQIQEKLQEVLFTLIEDETIGDVVISQNEKQCSELLAFREQLPEILTSHYSPHKNDISVPVADFTPFLDELETTIKKVYPDYEVVCFGHIGDGNVHVNVLKPKELTKEDFYKNTKECDESIFSIVKKYKGSISAEHGVGLVKKDYLHFSRTKEEINLMLSIKKMLDPKGILNPNKIFDLN